ncbi:hypothetical protein IFM89_020595, partial [Coptis chinensis]
VCVPFAGLSILLWPIAVALASLAGICSGFFLELYAAAVAYQVHFDHLLYLTRTLQRVVYSMSLLYWPCLMNTPMISSTSERGRAFLGMLYILPRYREVADYSVGRTVKRVTEKLEVVCTKQPL